MDVELALDCAPGIEVPDHAFLADAARRALIAAGEDAAPVYELAVRLIDERESTDLNGRYRDKPYPTNVLSFPADARLPGLVVLGDLAVCMPVVQREARAQGKTFDAHLCHMTVHGVLHLLGYDHIGDDEAEVMEGLERRIMTDIGYGDPYRDRVSG